MLCAKCKAARSIDDDSACSGWRGMKGGGAIMLCTLLGEFVHVSSFRLWADCEVYCYLFYWLPVTLHHVVICCQSIVCRGYDGCTGCVAKGASLISLV